MTYQESKIYTATVATDGSWLAFWRQRCAFQPLFPSLSLAMARPLVIFLLLMMIEHRCIDQDVISHCIAQNDWSKKWIGRLRTSNFQNGIQDVSTICSYPMSHKPCQVGTIHPRASMSFTRMLHGVVIPNIHQMSLNYPGGTKQCKSMWILGDLPATLHSLGWFHMTPVNHHWFSATGVKEPQDVD